MSDILCYVESCKFNEECGCLLDAITVGGSGLCTSQETKEDRDKESFEDRAEGE